ncbi:MAG: hypothetical protein PHU29_11805, partial [Sulfuricurvum sp.]|nr:hypothetical protein [Sulfuricurvum sp.]
MIIGSALLVLLYFKVSSALLSNPSDTLSAEEERIPYGFSLPLILLSVLIVGTGAGFIVIQHDALLALLALPLIFVFVLPWIMRGMERYDRTEPYHCGEKEPFDTALIYYEPTIRVKQMIYWSFTLLFAAVAVVGALS